MSVGVGEECYILPLSSVVESFQVRGGMIRTIGSSGRVVEVQCEFYTDSKSGTPGADTYKTKGVIHWVSVAHAYESDVRLYDRLFKVPNPGKATGEYIDDLNPSSLQVIRAFLEPSLREAKAGERFQFERHGYFEVDGEGWVGRTVTLRDSWGGHATKG